MIALFILLVMSSTPQETIRRELSSTQGNPPAARWAEPVNAKWFGAVGDGVADDTAAIQAALTASLGKVVYLPAGSYKITGPISITGQGTVLKGAGMGGGTRASQYESAPRRGTAILPAADINAIFVDDGCAGGAIEDLSIIWTQNDQNFLGIGIKLDPGLELFAVRRVLIVGQDRETGIYCEWGAQECTFDEVRTQNCFKGVNFPYDAVHSFPASFMRFTNCKLGGTFGICYGGQVDLVNCSFQGALIATRDEFDPAHAGAATANAKLVNCYFELSAGGTSFPFNVFPNKLQKPCAFINGDTLGNSDILTGLVGGGKTIALTAAGQQVVFTLSGGVWPVANIEPGMLLYIPAGSAFAGGAGQNVGYYVIENASSGYPTTTRITAYKWWEAAGAVYSTPPASVAATAANAVTDISHIRMVANCVSNGSGKLEIFGNTMAVFQDQKTPRCIVSGGAAPQICVYGGAMADAYTCVNNTQLFLFGVQNSYASLGHTRFMNSSGRAGEIFCGGAASAQFFPANFPWAQMVGVGALYGVQIQSGGSVLSGAGTPEGNVIGSPGWLYLRTDGGAVTSLYVKESGTLTNTGWVGK